MNMTIRPILPGFFMALFALTLPVESFATSPAALATSVTGKTSPAIENFSELQSSTKLTLAPDTEVEFVHYATCQTVVVKGGSLSFTAERFLLKGGNIVTTKRAKCPKTVVLAGASQIGGLVLRSASSAGSLRVGANPTFVLVGDRSESVELITVSLDGKTITEAAMPGRTFAWPKDAPPLEDGQAYTVTVRIKGADAPETFTIDSKSGGNTETLTLIRLD
jgi:hypothetical protein